MDSQAKTVKAQAIKSQEEAIEETKRNIRTRKETIDERIQSNDNWLALQQAKEEVTRLSEALARSLGSDGEYNNMLEDLGQLKDTLKDQRETLSMMIVGYFVDTKEQQLETDSNGDARELVITGKLGKKGKYQTNLFTGN